MTHHSTSSARPRPKSGLRFPFDPCVPGIDPFFLDDPQSGPGFPETAQERFVEHFRPSQHALIEMNDGKRTETGDRAFGPGQCFLPFTVENLRQHAYVCLSGGPGNKDRKPRVGPRYSCIVVDFDDQRCLDDLEQYCFEGCPPNAIGGRTVGAPDELGRGQAIWLIDPVLVWVGQPPQRNVKAEKLLLNVRRVMNGLFGDTAFGFHLSRSPLYAGEDREYTWHYLHDEVYKLDRLKRGLVAFAEEPFHVLVAEYVHKAQKTQRENPQLEIPLETRHELEEAMDGALSSGADDASWTEGRVSSRGVKGRFVPFEIDSEGVLQRNVWVMRAVGERLRSQCRSTGEIPSEEWTLDVALECNEVLEGTAKGPLDESEIATIARSMHSSFDPSKVSTSGTGFSAYTPEQRHAGGKKATRLHPEIFEKGRQAGRAAKHVSDTLRITENQNTVRELVEQGHSVAQIVRITGLSRSTVKRLKKP